MSACLPVQICWRWVGFSFGVDMVLRYHQGYVTVLILSCPGSRVIPSTWSLGPFYVIIMALKGIRPRVGECYGVFFFFSYSSSVFVFGPMPFHHSNHYDDL